MGIIGNIQKRGLEDITDFKVIKTALRSLGRGFTGFKFTKDELISYAEQLVYRMLCCPDCVVDKKCVNCDCLMPEGMMERDYKCKAGQFGKMKSPEEWEKWKKEVNFRFSFSREYK